MKTCATCQHPLGEGARFCSACGNVVNESTSALSSVPIGTRTCPACNAATFADTQFCHACGGSMEPPEETSVNEVLGNLDGLVAPWGRTVFLGRDEKGKSRRAEFGSDETGHFSFQDRQVLQQLLTELIYFDSYLSTDVMVRDQRVRCVWHVICTGVFALSESHAEFVNFYYESLLPTGTKETDVFTYADAPEIWSLD